MERELFDMKELQMLKGHEKNSSLQAFINAVIDYAQSLKNDDYQIEIGSISKTTSHADLDEAKFKSKRNSINIQTGDINSYSHEFSA